MQPFYGSKTTACHFIIQINDEGNISFYCCDNPEPFKKTLVAVWKIHK